MLDTVSSQDGRRLALFISTLLVLIRQFGAAAQYDAPRLSTQEIEANAGASKLAFECVAQAETMARQALANGHRLCAAYSMRLVGIELCAHHTAREHVDSGRRATASGASSYTASGERAKEYRRRRLSAGHSE